MEVFYDPRSGERQYREITLTRDFLIQLLKRALARLFVGAPAHEGGAVAEAIVGDLVEFHLDDEGGFQRLPGG